MNGARLHENRRGMFFHFAIVAAAITVPSTLHATYSIVARDTTTGEIGAAVQSHWFQVSHVIWVEPGVGAVATQSLADFTYGPAGLELLSLGRGAKEALEGLLETDSAPRFRQVAILDFDGDIAAHTGESCIAEAGHVIGKDYSVQANLMAKDTVPAAMAKAFESTAGDLAERLLASLEAAQAEGGDLRGQQSAALLVAKPRRTGRPWSDFSFDLRIDDHPEPVKEMRRLVQVARAYAAMNEGDLAIEDGDFKRAEEAYGQARQFAPGNAEVLFWYAVSLANAKQEDEAVEVMKEVYAIDPGLRILPSRLVGPGLLPDKKNLIRRLERAGK
jgi:uncharacterized Ntn-hydrolase superfamily protein